MKKILILLMALSLAGFLACGNDESDGQVSMSLSTEDGIEQMGNIAPGDPSYATYETDIAPWLDVLLIQAYANGYVAPRNQIMNQIVSKDALIRGEYLVLDVPAGRDLIFVVSAVDKNKVIQYSGKVGPVSVRPRSIIPLNVRLTRLISIPVSKDLAMNVRLLRNDGANAFDAQIDRFDIGSDAGSPNVKLNMYTQAAYVNNQWRPTNPDNGFDYGVAGGYDGTSMWTGGSFLEDSFILITAHVEDNTTSKAVVFYGARAFNSVWPDYSTMTEPLDIFMQHMARIIVHFNSYPGTTTVKAQMVVNESPRQLYKSGSFTDTNCTISIDSPIAVFSAPSGQEWFGGSNVIQSRTVIITDDLDNPIYQVDIPIEWGANHITVP